MSMTKVSPGALQPRVARAPPRSMPEPSISTCMAGSVTIRKTSAGLAATVRLAAIRSALDTVCSSVGSARRDTSDRAFWPADTVGRNGRGARDLAARRQREAEAAARPRRAGTGRHHAGAAPRGASPTTSSSALLYPTLPDELRPDVDEAAAGDLARVSTIRRMLGTIEHQVAPTAFSVQLAEEDAVRCTRRRGRAVLRRRGRRRDARACCRASTRRTSPPCSSSTARPGMTVVDVGANLGYYSLLASRLVGPSGRVVALEPNSENCRLLLSSLRLNETTNVQLLPVAADTATGLGLLLDARRLQRRPDRRRGPPVAPGHRRPHLPAGRSGGRAGGLPQDGRRRSGGPCRARGRRA